MAHFVVICSTLFRQHVSIKHKCDTTKLNKRINNNLITHNYNESYAFIFYVTYATYAKIEYVRIRTYYSENRIRRIRMLEL